MKPNSFTLAARLKIIRKKIEESCQAINKPPEDIKLVAVSKGQDFKQIKEAYELGIRDFGESYAQEFKSKRDQATLENLSDIRWHFLGALQSNKIKIISQATYIHSVDSMRHAQNISLIAQEEKYIFLQVKLDQTLGRLGFLSHEIHEALKACSSLPHIKIIGLMTIVPLSPPPHGNSWFLFMQKLREELCPDLKLSMGMSQDFEQAILYGADYIRIGSELFGPRS